MKKLFFSIFFISLFSLTFAQDDDFMDDEGGSTAVTNKKGEIMTPEAGDIAIGWDMVPVMNYIGNFANNSVGNTFNPEFIDNGTIFGKYFLDSETALRVRFSYDCTNSTSKFYVDDDAAQFADPLSEAETIDQLHSVSRDLLLGAGIEKHKGNGKLRGIYGGEIGIGFGHSKDEYFYGNPFSDVNTDPSDAWGYGNFRPLSNNYGSEFNIGVMGFVGVEYFFAPKMSLGSELGWGLGYTKSSQASHKEEYWNGNEAIERVVLDSPGGSSFGAMTSNPSLSFYLMFHF